MTEFIARAQAVHGVGTYDYSQVVYEHHRNRITIICPVHGSFEQQASSHLLTTRPPAGCKRCAYEKMGKDKCGSTVEFIARAQAVHGVGTYDYSQVVYERKSKPVRIICPQHGSFEQMPQVHKKGSGCQKCAAERLRLDWIERAAGRKSILYLLRFYSGCESFYKVGITCISVKHRYCSAESLGGYQYEILAQHTGTDAARIYDWEQSILETFAHLRYKPKRPFAGETECFSSADEILAIFPL